MCVSDTTLQASVVKETLKFRHQRTVNDTLQSFDSWILLTILGSRDMATKKLTIEPVSLLETSAQVINHMLLQFVIEHVLFYQFPFVSCLVCSSKRLSLYATIVLVVVVWFILVRKVSCSCGHVFVAKHNKHLKAYTA